MSDWSENKTYHESHKQNLLSTLGYNKTLIWLTIIFFVVSIILSFIFVYLPIQRIENRFDLLSATLVDEFEQGRLKFDQVIAFVDKIEPQVDRILNATEAVIREACVQGILRDPQVCEAFGAPIGIGGSGGGVGLVAGGTGSVSSSNVSVVSPNSLFNTRSF